MPRTTAKRIPVFLAVACTFNLLLCAARTAVGAPVAIQVQKRDGKPLAGAVLTLSPESQHLPAAPPVHAIVDQVDLAFVPDIIVIPVGSTVSFPNSDAVSHQVYSFSSARRFQLPLYRGKPYPPVTFDQVGLVTLGCNIHDNMLAYVIVTEAPFFGRTDAKGEWLAPNVPAGLYHLKLWHPLLNEPAPSLERTVEVGGEDHADVSLHLSRSLRPAPITGRPHSWEY